MLQRSTAVHEASGLGRASWIALGLLFAAYSFSWADRYVFAILIAPIQADLKLADWQIGLLSGFAFTLAYSIAALPFARVSDRGDRSRVIAIAVACWSVVTVAAGFVGSFAGLAATRSGVAVCEAGCSPAAHSLISDLFPRRRRALAFAIYGLGIPVGIWLGLSLGGMVSAAYGWRAAFVALGAPGLALALLVRFALREPPRGRFDPPGAAAATHYRWREAVALVWRRRAFVAIAFGLSFLSFNGSGVQLWAPTYLLRAGGSGIGAIGVFTGAVNGLAGIVGTLLAGYLADRFASRDPRWYVWIAIAAAGWIAVAQMLFLFLTGWPSALFYTATMFGVSLYTAPLFSAGQMLLPPRLRAFGAATMLFLLNLIGPGAGPAAIGAISTMLSGGPEAALRGAMACSIVGLVPAVACLLYAARRLAADLGDISG